MLQRSTEKPVEHVSDTIFSPAYHHPKDGFGVVTDKGNIVVCSHCIFLTFSVMFLYLILNLLVSIWIVHTSNFAWTYFLVDNLIWMYITCLFILYLPAHVAPISKCLILLHAKVVFLHFLRFTDNDTGRLPKNWIV